MNNYLSVRAAKIRKKRSMRITVAVHTVILVLALVPFLKHVPEKPYSQAIVIQFESAGSSHQGAKKSAQRAKSSEVLTPKKAEVPRAEAVKALPTKPVVTSPTDAVSVPEVKEVKVDVPVPEMVPNASPTPIDLPKDLPVDLPDIKIEEPVVEEGTTESADEGVVEGGTDNEVGSDEGSGSGEGNAATGEGDDDAGDGGEGSGDGMFSGDGILTRRIIERPNLSSIVAQEGTMSVNVCVDRRGNVTYVEFNPEYSTITDERVIREALNASADYKFERKMNAPNRECGRLSFKIEFEDRTKKKK